MMLGEDPELHAATVDHRRNALRGAKSVQGVLAWLKGQEVGASSKLPTPNSKAAQVGFNAFEANQSGLEVRSLRGCRWPFSRA